MRARLFTATFLIGAPLAACGIDLFHSTDFDSACRADPAGDACAALPDATTDGPGATGPDAKKDGPGADGQGTGDGGGNGSDAGDSGAPPGDSSVVDSAPTNFCAWSSGVANTTALRACAWLGACASGFGENALGRCYEDALRVYDCTVTPNQPALGVVHDFWDCLQRATTCGDVNTCISGKESIGCFATGENAGCAASGKFAADCVDGSMVAREACLGGSKRCEGTTACGGSPSVCAASQPADSGCNGNALYDCIGTTTDNGLDCSGFGQGKCVAAAIGSACKPSGAATCAPDAAVQCASGVAIGCPTGIVESVACKTLLGASGGCDPNRAGRPWDVSRACDPGSGPCTPACSGNNVVGCVRDKLAITLTCADYGLQPCRSGVFAGVTTFQCGAP